MPHQPLVSVVTPAYNAAAYLKECIESVLNQSYSNFEYVLLDNASADGTRDIAESYARRDPRIRVYANDATVPMIENWNRAIEKISNESVHCKILHADDFLYADCLTKMVGLAESVPDVGIVGSLRLRGDRIECEGLPRNQDVFSGLEVARMFLRREVFGFAPTSGLVRSDLVRTRRPFYPAKYLHSDVAVYFDLLDRIKFGFIHEVLTFSRTHENSMTTTVTKPNQTLMREWPFMLQEFGSRYFSPDEFDALERTYLRDYHRMLVRSLVTRRSVDFVMFHLAGLRAANRPPTALDVGAAVAAELAASVTRPFKLYRHLRDNLAHR